MCFQLGYFKDLLDSWPWKGTIEEHTRPGPCGADGWGSRLRPSTTMPRPCTLSSFSGVPRGPRTPGEGFPGFSEIAVCRCRHHAHTWTWQGPHALPSGADARRFLLAAPTGRGRPPPRRPPFPFRLRRHSGCRVGELKRPDTLAQCRSSTRGRNEAEGSLRSGCPSGGVKA